jgi:hypothetical protein
LNFIPYIAAAGIVVFIALLREALVRRQQKIKTMEADELMKRMRVELKRAARFQYNVAVVALDFQGSFSLKDALRLLLNIAPDQILKQEMREYDLILRLDPSLLFLIIPFQSDVDIYNVIESRLTKIAEDRRWKKHRMAIAIYPGEGRDAEEVREVCLQKLERTTAV